MKDYKCYRKSYSASLLLFTSMGAVVADPPGDAGEPEGGVMLRVHSKGFIHNHELSSNFWGFFSSSVYSLFLLLKKNFPAFLS